MISKGSFILFLLIVSLLAYVLWRVWRYYDLQLAFNRSGRLRRQHTSNTGSSTSSHSSEHTHLVTYNNDSGTEVEHDDDNDRDDSKPLQSSTDSLNAERLRTSSSTSLTSFYKSFLYRRRDDLIPIVRFLAF